MRSSANHQCPYCASAVTITPLYVPSGYWWTCATCHTGNFVPLDIPPDKQKSFRGMARKVAE